MSKITDYIDSLEGKENIDPRVIASTMLELHNEEMSTADSKIASLSEIISGHETTIAERDSALTAQKAKNWDLINRVPVANQNDVQETIEKNEHISNATFDDFFKDEN